AWCWLAADAVAVPWFWNIGGRFLMPAYVFAVLALMLAVPRAALACRVVQAFTCWPATIGIYNPADSWHLTGFPWQAALRLESEDSYLAARVPNYRITRVLESRTSPRDRIFVIGEIAAAYTDRQILKFWHSAEGDRILDWLR